MRKNNNSTAAATATKNLHHLSSSSSNFLIDKINLLVALRIFMLLFKLKVPLQKSSNRVKKQLEFSGNLRSITTYVLRKLKWKWRRKIIEQHSEFISSWKLYLNLFSVEWLKPNCSLTMSLMTLELWQLKTDFGNGPMNYER